MGRKEKHIMQQRGRGRTDFAPRLHPESRKEFADDRSSYMSSSQDHGCDRYKKDRLTLVMLCIEICCTRSSKERNAHACDTLCQWRQLISFFVSCSSSLLFLLLCDSKVSCKQLHDCIFHPTAILPPHTLFKKIFFHRCCNEHWFKKNAFK